MQNHSITCFIFLLVVFDASGWSVKKYKTDVVDNKFTELSDDAKIQRRIAEKESVEALQSSLDRIHCWNHTWQMELNTGHFWQITDIHWDQQYDEHGDPKIMCHKHYGNFTDYSSGYYGNYLCDSPWPLVRSAIQAMSDIENSPNFVLWTGDNAPHTDDPEPDFSTIFQTLSNITAELRTAFHDSVPIIPVLGNHDAYPKDDYPANMNSFYESYLTKGGWGALLPVTAQEEFIQGGYYAYPVRSGTIVLVLNTNLYYASNALGTGVKDPCGQMAWLRKKFQEAQYGEYKVIVAAHAPPGYFERNAKTPFFNGSYNEAYVDLLNEFGEVIQAQIYGHEHTDSFRIFASSKGKVRSVAFLAPSVTPWYPSTVAGGTAINPSIRLYTYNVSTIIDYKQYHLNLTKTGLKIEAHKRGENELNTDKGSPVWEEFYQARTKYNLESLDPDSILQLYERLIEDDDLFQKYYFFNSAGYDHGVCDANCKKGHICAIAHIKIDELERCMGKAIEHSAVHKVSDISLNICVVEGGLLTTCEDQSHIFIAVIALCTSLTVFLSAVLIIFKVKRNRLDSHTLYLPTMDWAKCQRGYRPFS